MTIAAALTNGGSDNLMVGRNGVFYDRKGQDWHATVVKIVENPISLRQAFLSPYKRFARFIDEQLTRRAEAAEQAANARLATAAETATSVGKENASSFKPRKIDVGTVAAIGVAVGSIGTFVSMILIRAIEMGPWLPLAVLGILFLISFPSVFLAWIRLRQRTLGPILDANGWAVNGQVKINLPLARSLTSIRSIPPLSSRRRRDPFADDSRKWLWLIAIVIAFAASSWLAYWLHARGVWTIPWQSEPLPEVVPTQQTPLAPN